MKMSRVPIHGGLSWQAFNEETTTTDDSSFTVTGLLEQVNATRDLSDYLWYSTEWVTYNSAALLTYLFILVPSYWILILFLFLLLVLWSTPTKDFSGMERILFLQYYLLAMLCMFLSMVSCQVSSKSSVYTISITPVNLTTKTILAPDILQSCFRNIANK